jgi:hypothetical protein
MHTIMVIGGGLVLLAVFLLAFNLYIGTRHGYSVAEELPIGLVVFGVPAAAAVLFWRRFARRS